MGIIQKISGMFSQKANPDWGTLERYLAWAFGGGASASGIVVNPQTAMQSSAVYSCIKVLAEGLAMLPLNLYTQDNKGARTLAENHPLFPLLHDQPNDYQTSVEFWEMVVLHVCLRGNFYAFKNRTAAGRIVELLPIHPDGVRVEMDSAWRVLYHVTLPDGSFKTYTTGDIFHIRGQTLNGWLGISPIAYAKESIGLALATEKFGGQLFRNGAKMGGVLEHPGKMSDIAYNRIKESFDAATSGENAHKTQILEEGMKFSKVSMTADDSQFLETRKYQRSEIAAIFRVPPHMIGDLEKATFSNIEQQSLEFVTYTLMPWLVRIEKAAKRDLMTPAERKVLHVKFNVAALLRGDAAARSLYYNGGINAGWLTRNEARASETDLGMTLNPIEGLDEPLRPLNMVGINEPVPAPAGAKDPDGDAAKDKAEAAKKEILSSSDIVERVAFLEGKQAAPVANPATNNNVTVESPAVSVAVNMPTTSKEINFTFDEDGNIAGATVTEGDD